MANAKNLLEIKNEQKIYNFLNKLYASDFVKKVVETFGTRVLLIIIGLATSVIIARILGPEGRGICAIATTIAAISMQFGNLGLHSSNTYYISKDNDLLPKLLGNSLFISLGLGSVIVFILGIIFYLLPSIVPIHGLILNLALLSVPIGISYLLLQNLLIGLDLIRDYNKIELISKIASMCILFIVILSQAVTPETVFLSGVIISIATLLWVLKKIFNNLATYPTTDYTLFKNNLFYGLKSYFACLFATIVSRVDILLISNFVGLKQAGIYAIASTIADMVSLIPTTVGGLLFPKLSAQKDFITKQKYTLKIGIILTIIMLIVVLFMCSISNFVINLFYGKEFINAANIFFWLAIGLLPLSFCNAYAQLLASIGNSYLYSLTWAICLGVKFCISFWIINNIGYEKIGISNFAITLIIFISTTLIIRRKNVKAFNG